MDKKSLIVEYQRKITLSNRIIYDANAKCNITKSILRDKENAMKDFKQILSEIEAQADKRQQQASLFSIKFPNTRFMDFLKDNLNATSTKETVKLSNSINQDILEMEKDILKDYDEIDLLSQKIVNEKNKIQYYRNEIAKLRSTL